MTHQAEVVCRCVRQLKPSRRGSQTQHKMHSLKGTVVGDYNSVLRERNEHIVTCLGSREEKMS